MSATVTLESKVRVLRGCQNMQEEKISVIQAKSQSLEHYISSEFAKLHTFLQDKESQLIQQLNGETAGILGKMEEKLNEVKELAEAIQRQVSDIHSKLQQEDSLFLIVINLHCPVSFFVIFIMILLGKQVSFFHCNGFLLIILFHKKQTIQYIFHVYSI
ncbi:nuclear factor 7, brain-like [Protopterus annectens]|uniref:nuclear factor 7, brain-like n=1 Tax=Protopterus annectens TaxID=7888 RepID=UPI001CFBC28F|nr:nuclear factor 7, brain-like [Protopterus annectens]